MVRLFSRRVFVGIALAAMLGMMLVSAAQADSGAETISSTCGADFAIPNGKFFTQTGGGQAGFSVQDDAEARFWTAFKGFGGIQALGYPVSHRFYLRGFLVQVFQKAVLQWDPASSRANVANTLDDLQHAGFDPWLEAFRQVPQHQVLAADHEAGFDVVIRNHLELLDANPAIRAAFLATPEWLTRLGLPIAYKDFGAVRVLRAQRAVLQQWVDDVPWARAGEVIFANSGDLAREAGLFPTSAVAPGVPDVVQPGETGLSVDGELSIQGATLLVRLATGRPDARANFNGRPLPLVCSDGEWQTLIGLSADAAPGPHTLQVQVGGASEVHEINVTVGMFPSIDLTIDSELTHLLDAQLVAQERSFLQAIIDQVTGPPKWMGVFGQPALGRASSAFGERRTFEPGAVKSLHEGADVAASHGATVQATADGTVAWAGPLAIRGNSVIVDHGFGVFSAVAHLDAIHVVTGDLVTRGQAIGTVGSSGRSTGPHVHWEVHVAGSAVDPRTWLQRDFFELTKWTGYRMSAGMPTSGVSESGVPDQALASKVAVGASGETGQPPAEGPAG